ncbi:hypothetical protein CJI97_003884 [Candidozyma auris]|nr:hypothetical protein CJI97_003884 [[Candida] auris]
MSQWHDIGQFELIRSLYGHICCTKCSGSVLQLLPSVPDGEILYHETEENDVLDIAMSKKTYMLIFTEAHTFFGAKGYKFKLETFTEPELEKLYMATNGILLTTNDHFTVWRTHRDVVLEMLRRGDKGAIERDFTYTMFLATSKLKRINKSSVLFTWIRKLFVALSNDKNVAKLLIFRLLRSMEVHFANYYAGFTTQWLVQVLQAKADEEILLFLGKNLREKCRTHLGDVTLWGCYSMWLNASKLDHFALQQFKEDERFWRNEGIKVEELDIDSSGSRKPVIVDVDADLDWLLKVQCPRYTPFECLYNATENRSDFLIKIRDHLETQKSKTRADPDSALSVQFSEYLALLQDFLSKHSSPGQSTS